MFEYPYLARSLCLFKLDCFHKRYAFSAAAPLLLIDSSSKVITICRIATRSGSLSVLRTVFLSALPRPNITPQRKVELVSSFRRLPENWFVYLALLQQPRTASYCLCV